ncbi:MAG: zinc carboxypeptidase, partial [Bacteroidetes bacterium]
LTITSPENHQKLDQIQATHLKLCDPQQSAGMEVSDMPVVLWMGYSIHGNEASGSNASMLVAYYLAAAQGPEIEQKLRETVILFDPSYNPDGLHRFSTWVNSHRGIHEVSADPNDREHNEAWPGGRTNHYWFDLNRDWLPTQHPESQARVLKFHQWKPNWLTDHHEMSTNATFFFQPGVPSRTHPLTPEQVTEFSRRVGNYHARALDSIGSLYFTEERYDDFYYGKGSTYPDVNGGVGILFEQASSRGHRQESVNGVLSFPFAIRNQVTTSLSTLQGVHAIRRELLEYQRDFFQSALKKAAADPVKAFVFGSAKDPARAWELARILQRHDIQLYRPAQSIQAEGHSFEPASSYLVPLNQPQYRLIHAIFDTQTTFEDSLFYDISTWTFPLAFNLDYAALPKNAFRTGETVSSLPFPKGRLEGGKSEYAYLFEWYGYYAPRALYKLQQAGLRTKVATQPFAFGDKTFSYGTILVPVQQQSLSSEEIHQLMEQISQEDGINVYAMQSGLSPTGPDLGSSTFELLQQPKVGLLIGEGVSGYEAGEVWHLLDQRFHIPLTKIELKELEHTDLSRYNTLIMVSGRNHMSQQAAEQVREWVRKGGLMVGTKGALHWLSGQGLLQYSGKSSEHESQDTQLPFANRANRLGAQVTGGAIFQARLDLSHPIAYGYEHSLISLFRNHNTFVQPAGDPYHNPILYTQAPLQSGYISAPNLKALAGSSALVPGRYGRGRVICLVDNPNFRAFWYGTNKLFMNALFFGRQM